MSELPEIRVHAQDCGCRLGQTDPECRELRAAIREATEDLKRISCPGCPPSGVRVRCAEHDR